MRMWMVLLALALTCISLGSLSLAAGLRSDSVSGARLKLGNPRGSLFSRSKNAAKDDTAGAGTEETATDGDVGAGNEPDEAIETQPQTWNAADAAQSHANTKVSPSSTGDTDAEPGSRVPGVRIRPKNAGAKPVRAPAREKSEAGPPLATLFSSESSMTERGWPILDHLGSLLTTGHLDERKLQGGMDAGKAGPASGTGGPALPDASSLSRPPPGVWSSLEQGAVGPLPVRVLRTAYEADTEAAKMWEGLASAMLGSQAASRHPCIALASASATRLVEAAYASAAATANNVKAGAVVGASTAVKAGVTAVAGDTPLFAAPPSPDSVRAAVIAIVEGEYRRAVTELVTGLWGGGGGGGSLALTAPARGMASPPSSSPSTLPYQHLPPRPALVHDGAAELGDKPILVLGAGAGFVAARIAAGLPNSTVIGLTWGRGPSTAGEGEREGDELSPSTLATALKSELGLANMWVAALGASPAHGTVLTSVLAFVRSWTRDGPGGNAWLPKAQAQAGGVGVPHWDALVSLHPDVARALAQDASTWKAATRPGKDLPGWDPLPGRFALGALVLPNLSPLHGALLPHEFEGRMGALLATTRILLIPSTLPDTRFFSYWPSSEALVRAAADAAGLVLTLAPGSGLSSVLVVSVQSAEEASYERSVYDRVRGGEGTTLSPNPLPWDGSVGVGVGVEWCPSHVLPHATAAVSGAAARASKASGSPLTPSLARTLDAALAALLPRGGGARWRSARRGLVTPAHAAHAAVPLPFLLGLGLVRADAASLAIGLAELDAPSALLTHAGPAAVGVVGGVPVLAHAAALGVQAGTRAGTRGGSGKATTHFAARVAEFTAKMAEVEALAKREEEEAEEKAKVDAKAKADAMTKPKAKVQQPVSESKKADVPKTISKMSVVEVEEAEETGAGGAGESISAGLEKEEEEEGGAEEDAAHQPLQAKKQKTAVEKSQVKPVVVKPPPPAAVVDAGSEEKGRGEVEAIRPRKRQGSGKKAAAEPVKVKSAPVAEDEGDTDPYSDLLAPGVGGIIDVRTSNAATDAALAEDEDGDVVGFGSLSTDQEDEDALVQSAAALKEATQGEEVLEEKAPVEVKAKRGTAGQTHARGRQLLQETQPLTGKGNGKAGSRLFARSAPVGGTGKAPAVKDQSRPDTPAADDAPSGLPRAVLPILTDTRWSTLRPVRAPPASTGDYASLFEDGAQTGSGAGKRLAARAEDLGLQQARLVETETPIFRAWWKAIGAQSGKWVNPTGATSAFGSFPILVQGRHMSLLSAKLARANPSSFVLSVKDGEGDVRPHADLLRLLGTQNNVLAMGGGRQSAPHGLLTEAATLAIGAAGNPFALQCIAAEALSQLTAEALPFISSAQDRAQSLGGDAGSGADVQRENIAAEVADAIGAAWEARLGALLRLSGVTVAELPPFALLLHPLRLVTPVCSTPCALHGAAFADEEGDAVPLPRDDDGDGYLELTRSAGLEDELLDGEDTDTEFESLLADQEDEGPTDLPDGDGEVESGERPFGVNAKGMGAAFDSLLEGDSRSLSDDTTGEEERSGSIFERKKGRGRSLLQLRGGGGGGVKTTATPPVLVAGGRGSWRTLKQRLPSQNSLAVRVTELLHARYTSLGSTPALFPSGEEASLADEGVTFTRVFGPYRALFTRAVRAAGLSGSARFIREAVLAAGSPSHIPSPHVFLHFTAPALTPSHPGLPLHNLLAAGVLDSVSARLARLFLSLPLPAIMRGAAQQGHGTTSSSPLTLSPWDVHLVPDASPACVGRLLFSLPPGEGEGSWSSPLCLRPTADGDDDEQDLGSGEHSGASNSAHGTPGWEGGADAPTTVRELWAALASQLHGTDTASGGEAGRFSAVEHGSGAGSLSLALARAFPMATVLSIESDAGSTDAHMAAALRGGIGNNIIARGSIDSELMKRLHDSPEFFRYQILGRDLLGMIGKAAAAGGGGGGMSGLQTGVGTMLALAATTFLRIPSAAHLSLAFTLFGDARLGYGLGKLAVLEGSEANVLGRYTGEWVGGVGRGGGGACAPPSSSPLFYTPRTEDGQGGGGVGLPTLRCLPGRGIPHAFAGVTLADIAEGGLNGAQVLAVRKAAAAYDVSLHPRPALHSAEMRLLGSLLRAPGGTSIRVSAAPVPAPLVLPASMDDIGPPTGDEPSAAIGLSAVLQGQRPIARDRARPWSSHVLQAWPAISSGLVRVDIANMTRHVNHHFQSDIDGHNRKYTLRVQVNITAGVLLAASASAAGLPSDSPWPLGAVGMRGVLSPGNHPNHGHTVLWTGEGETQGEGITGAAPTSQLVSAATAFHIETGAVVPGVTSIILTRDTDGAFIPYETVYGITLITGLRLGLLAPLRTRAYHQFVSLPLYQDMAPWNIVFTGPRLDYIDFDTKDRTYDAFVPKAYEVMEVLFNYKRTLEDFKKCGGKGSNPYGFPFVSDCVGSSFGGPCKDSALPVPCGDGTCRSDYVSCLRALSDSSRSSDLRADLLWAFRAYDSASAANVRAVLRASRRGRKEGVRQAPFADSVEGEEEGDDASPGTDDADEVGGRASGFTPTGARDGGEGYIHTLFGRAGVDDRSSGTAKKVPKEESEDGAQPPSRLRRSSDVLAGSIARGTLEYGTEGARAPRDN